jgi:hypothetical protein
MMMNKMILNHLVQELDVAYQVGILSEIRSFCDYKHEQQVINAVNLKYGNCTYHVSMKMNQFSFSEAKILFTEFVRFIEYSDATFYVIETSDRSVMYYLLSCTKDKKGIFSQVKIH